MEQHLLYLINRQWTNPALDFFMTLMSSADAWTIPIAIAIAAALILGGFRARAMVFCGVIVLGLGDGLISKSLKKIVARPRPGQVVADVRLLKFESGGMTAVFKPVKEKMSRPETGQIAGRSFPSAHTMNNFCAAVVLTFFYPWRGWLYFVPAACVGYSRIYTGAHWPSDVLTSAFLAAGWSLLCLALFEYLWRQFGSRVMPAVFARHPSLFRGATS